VTTSPPPVQSDQQAPYVRPSSVAAVALVLILVGVLAALTGVGLSAASSCCGSSDPADPTPTLVGIVVAVALCAAGYGIWTGRASRRTVLLCAAVVPVVVLAVSPSSSDFAGLVPFVVVGWLWLWWYLRRPAASAWVGQAGTERRN
jgi:hypothetical protein